MVRLTTGWLRYKTDDPLPPNQPAARWLLELLHVFDRQELPIWPWCRCGILTLRAQGLLDEALAYAAVSRGLNLPDSTVDAECDRPR